jgi:hypothetical protein
VELGRFLKPVEHVLYAAIARVTGYVTVAKGYNAGEVASIMRSHWDSFRCPAAIGLDASRFDQHVSEEALRWEHSVYRSIFGKSEGAKVLNWLLKQQLQNRCVFSSDEGRVKYTTEGKRMSGDVNTALGNCLIMCALVWTYAQEKSIIIKFVNNGDDVLVFLERGNVGEFMNGLHSWFLDFGFTMTAEKPVYDFERCEFCQTRPVHDGGTWTMVRNPEKGMCKDGLWKKPDLGNPERAFRAWGSAVGECGLALAGGIPVYDALYRKMAELGPQAKCQGFGDMSSGFEYLAKGMNRRWLSVSDHARYSYWMAFGVLPDEQVAAEDYIRGWSGHGVQWLISPDHHQGHPIFAC